MNVVLAMSRRLLACLLPLLFAGVAFGQTTSWDTMAQVRLVKQDGRYVPEFEAAVLELAGTEIQLKGFMLPLDQSPKQAHFLLSANPVAECFFCLPGGPESLVEVKLDGEIDFSYDPIAIAGTLELLEDDPMGMYYRLVSARVATD